MRVSRENLVRQMSSTLSKPPFYLPAILAVTPALGAISWLLLGSLDGPRNQSVIDLLPLFQMLGIFLAVLYGITREGFLRRPPVPVAAALGLSAVVILAGLTLNATHPAAAATELLLRLALIALAVATIYLCQRFDRRLWDAFGTAILLIPIVHLPVLVLLYLLYIDEPAMNWLGGPVGFEHVRLWGAILATALAMGFGMRRGPFLWGVATVLWALLLWSGSRGAVLGLGAAYLLSLALFWRQMRGSVLPFVATAAAGAGLSLLPKLPMVSYGLIPTLLKTVEASSGDDATGGRLSMWRDAFDYFTQHPVIGHGFDHYRYLTEGTETEWLHPHNIVLQLLVDLGIVGALCVAGALLFYWARGLGKALADRDPTRIGAFTALNALVAMSVFDGTLYHPETTTLVAVLFGMLLAHPRTMDSPAR